MEHIFATQLGSTSTTDNKSLNELFIDLPKKQKVNLLVLEEDIKYGQHIKTYKVDVYINNQWETIAEGQSIGRKRIQTFDPVKTNRIRLRLYGESEKSLVKGFEIYFTDI